MAGIESEPRKQFNLRLEESVIEALGAKAKAHNLSTVDYTRNIVYAAINGEPSESRADFGLDAAVMSRITDDAKALNIAPAAYIRTLIYNALTKDPGQDIDELRVTVLALSERLEHLEHTQLDMFEALLLTLAKDSGGHTGDQVGEMLKAVFPRK